MKGNIDQNNRMVGKAEANAVNDILPLIVNPATGKLKIEIIPRTLDPFVVNKENLPIDENARNIGGAITNDANQTITPLSVDLISGVGCLRIETP